MVDIFFQRTYFNVSSISPLYLRKSSVFNDLFKRLEINRSEFSSNPKSAGKSSSGPMMSNGRH